MDENIRVNQSSLEAGSAGLFLSLVLMTGAGVLFVAPFTQLLDATFFPALLLVGLAGFALSKLKFELTSNLITKLSSVLIVFGLLLWTSGWIVSALNRGLFGTWSLVFGFLLLATGFLLDNWSSLTSWWSKAIVLLNLLPSLSQLTNLDKAEQLAAGTQFYIFFLFSIGWLLIFLLRRLVKQL